VIPTPTLSETLVSAGFAQAGARGWCRLDLRAIAAEIGEPTPSGAIGPIGRAMLLRSGLDRGLAALDGSPEGDGVRDRLFDLLMRRFDALAPLRPGFAALRKAPVDPGLLAIAASHLPVVAMRAARAAGLAPIDPLFPLRIMGLTAIIGRADQVFATDESDDLGATMASLDGALTQAAALADRFGRRRESPKT
jgi:hypothetical protein